MLHEVEVRTLHACCSPRFPFARIEIPRPGLYPDSGWSKVRLLAIHAWFALKPPERRRTARSSLGEAFEGSEEGLAAARRARGERR